MQLSEKSSAGFFFLVYKMRHNNLVPPSQANTSKNLYFLVVVASLPARGLGIGVRKGLQRVVGAIISY